MKQGLIILVTLFSIIGTGDYIWNILRGKTRPHRTTRFVLFLVSITNLIGTIAADAPLATKLLALLFFVRSLTLAVLSIKNGLGGTSKLDISCAVIAVLGIIAWELTGSGLWALVFAILADAVAYIPAVIKTWLKPKTEAPLMYWLEGAAAILAIVHDGLRPSVIFQAYIVLACVVMLACIYRPTLARNKTSS